MNTSLPKNKTSLSLRNKKLISISEAAKVLDVSIDTIRRWDRKGILHSQRPDGKNRFFSIDELEKVKFAKALPISEASKYLGISTSTLRRIEAKGLIKPERNEAGERVYSRESLEKFLKGEYFLRQRKIEEKILAPLRGENKVSAIQEEPKESPTHKVLAVLQEETREEVSKLITFKKALSLSGLFITATFTLLVIIITILFLLYPKETAQYFGYKNKPVATKVANLTNQTTGAVLGVTYAPPDAKEASQQVLGTVLKPVSGVSLGIIKQISPKTYEQIVPAGKIEDINDVFVIDEGGNVSLLNNLKLSQNSLQSLNADSVKGKKPGEQAGDLATLTAGGVVPGLKAVSGLSAGVVRSGAGGELSSGAVSLANEVDGTLGLTHGGTGGVTASDARTALGLKIGTDIPSLTGSGVSGNWGIDISGSAGSVSGTVDTDNGGTGKTSWTKYALPYLSGTTAFGEVAIGSVSQVLQVNSGATGYQWHTLSASDIGLSGVENTALSTWTGSSYITTTGTLTSLSVSGNVGIGATAPSEKLEVSGTIKATAFSGPLTGNITGDVTGNVSGNAGTVTNGVYTTGSYTDPAWLTSLAASKVGLGSVENTALSTWTGSTYLTTAGVLSATSLSTTGNIGIGTTVTSAYNLSVNGTINATSVSATTFTGALSGNAATVSNGVYTTGSYSNPTWLTGLTTDRFASASVSQWTNDANYIAASATITGLVQSTTAGSSYFTGGNVGIGTTAPTGKLDIIGSNGNVSVTPDAYSWLNIRNNNDSYLSLLSAANAYAGILFGDSDNNDIGRILYNHPSNYMAFFTNDGEKVRINSSGNLGIGTTGPGARLQIKQSSSSNFPAAPTFTNAGLSITNFDGLYGLYSGVTDAGKAWLQVGRNDAVTYYSLILQPNGGNVGIGTTGPGSTLAVNGNAIFGFGKASLIVGPSNGLGVSGNVGIGTTTTSHNLEVVGTGAFSSTVSLGNGSSSTPALNFSNLTNAGLWTNGDGLLLTTGGSNTSGLTVTGAGNIGIGTTNPTYKLQVNNGSILVGTNSQGINFTGSGGSIRGGVYVSSGNYLSLVGADNGYNFLNSAQNATLVTIQNGGNVGIGTQSPVGLLQVGNSPTPGLIVLSGGNIGIGTTGPSSPLDVWANVPTVSQQIRIVDSDTNYAGRLSYDQASSTIFGLYNSYNNASARIDFGFGTAAPFSTIPKLSIIGSGNVGIGTTSPGYTLDVAGSINISSGNALYFTTTGTNKSIKFYNTPYDNNFPAVSFYPSSGTNVGSAFSVIPKGTGYSSGIKSEITIFNTDYVADAVNYESMVVRAGGTDGYSFAALKSGSGSVRPIWFDATGEQSSTTANLFLATTGNMGIGTVSPTSKLLVSGGNVGIGVTSALSTLAVNGNSTIGWGITGIAGPTNGLGISGNVGIGTTTTSHNLEVVGTGAFSSTLSLANGSASAPAYSFTDSASTGIFSPSANALAFNTNGATTPPFTITSAGNIGIGVTAPVQMMELYGNKPYIYQLSSLAANPAFTQYSNNGSANVYLGIEGSNGGNIFNNTLGSAAVFGAASSGKATQLVAGGSVVMTLLNGNVGIGTTGPADKFEIYAATKPSFTMSNGDAAAKTRLSMGGTGKSALYSVNYSVTNDVLDVSTDPGWVFYLGSATDQFSINRVPASGNWASRTIPFLMNSSGNVGIGTTGPTSKLQVVGDIAGTTFNGNTITSGTGTLTLANSLITSGNYSLTLTTTGTTNVTLPTTGTLATLAGTETLSGKTFSGNTYFPGSGIWGTGGNVGIGTTGPGFKLEIVDSAIPMSVTRSETGTTNLLTTFMGTHQTTGTMADGFGASMLFRGLDTTGVTTDYFGYTGGVRDGAHNSGALVFGTYNAGSSGERMRIDHLGNVGISTVSPSALFSVGASSQFQVNSSGAITTNATGTALTLSGVGTSIAFTGAGLAQITTSSQNLALMTGTGNVGIGTTNPGFLLDIQGTLALANITRFSSSAANTGPGFLFSRARGTTSSPSDITAGDWLGKTQFQGRISGAMQNYGAFAYIASDTSKNGRFSFTDNDLVTERMVILNAGNVGIGTTRPAYTLEVNGTGKLNDTGWTYGSDVRLKENITYISSALGVIEGLRPANFDYINGGKKRSGFIAQEVQTVLPNIVSVDSSTGMLGLRVDEIIPYLVKGMQEQQAQISDLSAFFERFNFGENKIEGLEIISPKVTTNTLTVANIKAVQKDITLNLTADGRFILQNEASESAVVFDSVGNATFKGTVTAEKIKANQIEGLELAVSSFKFQVSREATASAQTINLNDLLYQASVSANLVKESTDRFKIYDLGFKIATESGAVNMSVINKLTAEGGIVVSGQAQFKGKTIFEALVEFFDNVIFHKDVTFEGRTTFNNDTAGSALIQKGADFVLVRFSKEYPAVPLVNISITLDQKDDLLSEASQSALERQILDNDIKYIVTRRTTKGFMIKLNKPSSADLTFSWSALAVKDAKTTVSDQVAEATLGVQTAATPVPTATLTAAVQESTASGFVKPLTVKINGNELGFLRVRKEASTTSDEVAQVLPGQTFQVLVEQNGWYEIEYKQDFYGWIMGSYVTVL